MTTSRLLTLSTVPQTHARRSGYQLLPEYIPNANSIWSVRTPPSSLPARALTRFLRAGAFTKWYLNSCAILELRALRRLATGFDGIVHALWADHDLGYLDLLTRSSRHRLVGTFHSCIDTLSETIRYPKRLRRFDAIILMSESQRPFFLGAGVPAERIHVILHGVDCQHFTPTHYTTQRNKFIVLSVGGHRRRFDVLQALCRLTLPHPAIHYRIIGPVDRQPMFAGFANVTFQSSITDDQLLRAYHDASCFLMAVEAATANNAILEAMSCALPIVAENVGGIPEYVSPQCSRLSAPGDIDGLLAAITEIAHSAPLRASMADAARKRAEELDWNLVANRTVQLYDDLLAPHSNHPLNHRSHRNSLARSECPAEPLASSSPHSA